MNRFKRVMFPLWFERAIDISFPGVYRCKDMRMEDVDICKDIFFWHDHFFQRKTCAIRMKD